MSDRSCRATMAEARNAATESARAALLRSAWAASVPLPQVPRVINNRIYANTGTKSSPYHREIVQIAESPSQDANRDHSTPSGLERIRRFAAGEEPEAVGPAGARRREAVDPADASGRSVRSVANVRQRRPTRAWSSTTFPPRGRCPPLSRPRKRTALPGRAVAGAARRRCARVRMTVLAVAGRSRSSPGNVARIVRDGPAGRRIRRWPEASVRGAQPSAAVSAEAGDTAGRVRPPSAPVPGERRSGHPGAAGGRAEAAAADSAEAGVEARITVRRGQTGRQEARPRRRWTSAIGRSPSGRAPAREVEVELAARAVRGEGDRAADREDDGRRRAVDRARPDGLVAGGVKRPGRGARTGRRAGTRRRSARPAGRRPASCRAPARRRRPRAAAR